MSGESTGTSFIVEKGILRSPANIGNQVISLTKFSGHIPKAVIITGASKTSDNATTGDVFICFGMGGVNNTGMYHQWSMGMAESGDSTESLSKYQADQFYLITNQNALSAIPLEQATLIALEKNSFTINWNKVNTADFIYYYTVIGGDDVQIDVRNIMLPDGAGEIDVDTGFLPVAMMAMASPDHEGHAYPFFSGSVGFGVEGEQTTASVYSVSGELPPKTHESALLPNMIAHGKSKISGEDEAYVARVSDIHSTGYRIKSVVPAFPIDESASPSDRPFLAKTVVSVMCIGGVEAASGRFSVNPAAQTAGFMVPAGVTREQAVSPEFAMFISTQRVLGDFYGKKKAAFHLASVDKESSDYIGCDFSDGSSASKLHRYSDGTIMKARSPNYSQVFNTFRFIAFRNELMEFFYSGETENQQYDIAYLAIGRKK